MLHGLLLLPIFRDDFHRHLWDHVEENQIICWRHVSFHHGIANLPFAAMVDHSKTDI